MSGDYTGRGFGAGPVTEFFPLSAATASSPGITIISTTATAGATVIHTADKNAQDVLYVTVANNTAADLIAYGNLGTIATTGTVQKTIPANDFAMIFNANAAISNSGVVNVWTSATAGLIAYGYVARTFTASS
tara:strand:+ start:242 stop:640 length:399 start_codon:yes stop_codon:yes gene_type:complete